MYRKSNIIDEQAKAWAKEIKEMLKAIVVEFNPDFAKSEITEEVNSIIKETYNHLWRVYGLVADQLKHEYKEKYSMDALPTLTQAIADNESWASLFRTCSYTIATNKYEQLCKAA